MYIQKQDYKNKKVLPLNKKISTKTRELSILIVDDDKDTLDSVKFMIESHSHQAVCDQAADAYEALLALCDHHYDFVLVDYRLPGMNGLKLLRKIDKHIELDPLIVESSRFDEKIPIVIMSGQSVELPKDLHFKNFSFVAAITKQDLAQFLSKRFAS